jgi:hypothetical protein
VFLLSTADADQFQTASYPDGTPQVFTLGYFNKLTDKYTSTPRLLKNNCPFAVVDINNLMS